jgi:hypothetical protein
VYDDLLEQARIPAKLDVKKPKQANLRRAVSSAYYAVFHFLVHEACCAQIGTQHAQAAYRHVLGRAFVHGHMFVELQEKRHLADYDLTERFERSDVLSSGAWGLAEN